MEVEELRKRVEAFPQWHYEFDLGGVRTPVFQKGHVNRHWQRKKYFFSPIVDLCGGSLAGKRVLDLACNAGFWSLCAVEAGAEFVLGVDGRQMHIDQANLVFEVKGVERRRYRFEMSDVFAADLSDEAPFDVVLCLGLLYHVSKPFELFERLSTWCDDLLVVDTAIYPLAGPYFRIVSQEPDEPRSATDRAVALQPTAEAVTRLATEFGFTAATMLRPRFTSWKGAWSYRRGTRRAFICSKKTPLDRLDAEPVPVGHTAVPTQPTSPATNRSKRTSRQRTTRGLRPTRRWLRRARRRLRPTFRRLRRILGRARRRVLKAANQLRGLREQ